MDKNKQTDPQLLKISISFLDVFIDILIGKRKTLRNVNCLRALSCVYAFTFHSFMQKITAGQQQNRNEYKTDGEDGKINGYITYKPTKTRLLLR